MSAALTGGELALLELLRRALNGEDGFPEAIQAQETEQALSIARAHAVLPLLYPVLPQEPCAKAAEICAAQYYHLLFLTRYYVRTLEAQGIGTLVLKGPGAAAAYPVPEYRKSGDIDLLLLDAASVSKAREIILSTGAAEEPEQHANHHISFRTPDGIILELHITLAEDFDDRKVNRLLLSLQEDMGEHAAVLEALPGVFLPAPDAPRQAMSLLLHMLQHFLRAGFGLKLLCDWVVFWNAPRSPGEREEYLRCAEACGVAGFSALISGVCVRYLGLDAAALPHNADEALCIGFLREIFDAEEFGRTSAQRMVMVRGGLGGYLREFHHQMLLNFPKKGKKALLWPFLWAATLVRFLHNNRVLRKTSLSAILRETERRSRLTDSLHLFENVR